MLRDKIQADLMNALKSGDKVTLDTLRYVMSQIKNKEIDLHHDLSDEEIVDLLRKQNKELQESLDAFQKGNRTDLASQTEAQQKVIAQYLPAEMSDAELTEEIRKVVEANRAAYTQNPKAVIGIVVKELKSKAEPSRISKILNTQTF
jgi:uncharacterized protein